MNQRTQISFEYRMSGFRSLKKRSQRPQQGIEGFFHRKQLRKKIYKPYGLQIQVDTTKSELKEAVNATVRIIFEDPGVEELLVGLYHKEWCDGNVTEYLIATFGDYFTDVKMYVEEGSFRRFVEACLEETIVVYVDHLLTQKNYIKEETIERMRLDEGYLMNFFKEYITVSEVENRVSILNGLRELASAESLDAFTLGYTNILEHQPDCPPEVVEKLVALREGIPQKDSKEIVQKCKEIYTNSHVDENPPKAGFIFPWSKCLIASEGSGELDQEKLMEEMRQRMLDLHFSSVDV